MSNKVTQEEIEIEQQFAKNVSAALVEEIEKATGILAKDREKVLDDRAYFIDYFREMHKDEREDWLQFEHANLKKYDNTKVEIERNVRLLNSPYFGKVAFNSDRLHKLKNYYIGIYDFANYIIDWRAPVSALYYESEVGKTSYQAPAGEMTGELMDKKRFRFENGELKNVSNINLPSDDEFLTGILSENSSDYLKVIVSSLQKDQNKIVRDFVDGVHVIAGCAGSGKSSIAMHKIAYILYAFREKIQGKGIAILSPNDAFEAYISHILPELGETNVNTITQERLIDMFTADIETEFLTREQSTEKMLTSKENIVLENVKFKNSEDFKTLIDLFTNWYESNCFNPRDIILSKTDDEAGIKNMRINADNLRVLFYDNLSDYPVLKRPEVLISHILTRLHANDDELENRLRAEIYSMILPFDVVNLYNEVFENETFYATLPDDFKSRIGDIRCFNLKPYVWEDRVAIAYIKLKLHPGEYDSNVFYFFCDEAQDLSPVMIGLLKECYGTSHILFAGDLAQNVFCNTADYADMIKKEFSGKHFKKYELNTNYRSTKQISEFACARTGRTNENSAVRTGDEVRIIKGDGTAAEIASKWLREINETTCERVAVLTMTKGEADSLYAETELPENLRVRPYFLPVYLAKGLEFDAVLIVNKDGKMESEDKRLGTNMFYTACTRAMHSLTVIE